MTQNHSQGTNGIYWKIPDYSPAERLADDRWRKSRASDTDADGYISFADLARMRLGNQCQDISRHLNPDFTGDPAYPYLGLDVRIKGWPAQYRSLTIHWDDVEYFVERVREFRKQRLQSLS